jgi:hypothetical protein
MNAERITLSIAFCAMLISLLATINAWRTTTYRNRLESRDPRQEIRRSVADFFSGLEREGEVKREFLAELLEAHQNAQFYFGKDVNRYLEKLKKRARCLMRSQERMISCKDEQDRLAASDRNYKELVGLLGLKGDLNRLCQPYLRLDRK